MKYLAINTAFEEAHIVLIEDAKQLASQQWPSDRTLSDQLVGRIEVLLKDSSVEFDEIDGIIVHTGPGSFTSLRIGVTVANTLASTLGVPIAGVGAKEDVWITEGVTIFAENSASVQVVPNYGAEPHITKPRK